MKQLDKTSKVTFLPKPSPRLGLKATNNKELIRKQWAYTTVWVAHQPSGDKWGATCSLWWARSWAHSSNPPSRLWYEEEICTLSTSEFIIISSGFSSSSFALWTEDRGHTVGGKRERMGHAWFLCSTVCTDPDRIQSQPPGGVSGSLTVLHQYSLALVYT